MKKHEEKGQWFELSDQQAKEKIAHAVRDAVNSNEARRQGKKLAKKEIKQWPSSQSSYTRQDKASDIPPFVVRDSSHLRQQQNFAVSDHADPRNEGAIYRNLEAASRHLGIGLDHHQAEMQPGFFPSRATQHPFSGSSSQLNVSVASMFPEDRAENDSNTETSYKHIRAQQPENSDDPNLPSFHPGSHIGAPEVSGIALSQGAYGTNYDQHATRTATLNDRRMRVQVPENLAASDLSSFRPGSHVSSQERRDIAHTQSNVDLSRQYHHLGPSIQQQQTEVDPFLDRINEVLGPMAMYSDTHQSTSTQQNQDDRHTEHLEPTHNETDTTRSERAPKDHWS